VNKHPIGITNKTEDTGAKGKVKRKEDKTSAIEEHCFLCV
jgi:hypothetical protein